MTDGEVCRSLIRFSNCHKAQIYEESNSDEKDTGSQITEARFRADVRARSWMGRRGTRIDCESLANVSREKQIKGKSDSGFERSSDPEASSTSRLGSVSHCSTFANIHSSLSALMQRFLRRGMWETHHHITHTHPSLLQNAMFSERFPCCLQIRASVSSSSLIPLLPNSSFSSHAIATSSLYHVTAGMKFHLSCLTREVKSLKIRAVSVFVESEWEGCEPNHSSTHCLCVIPVSSAPSILQTQADPRFPNKKEDAVTKNLPSTLFYFCDNWADGRFVRSNDSVSVSCCFHTPGTRLQENIAHVWLHVRNHRGNNLFGKIDHPIHRNVSSGSRDEAWFWKRMENYVKRLTQHSIHTLTLSIHITYDSSLFGSEYPAPDPLFSSCWSSCCSSFLRKTRSETWLQKRLVTFSEPDIHSCRRSRLRFWLRRPKIRIKSRCGLWWKATHWRTWIRSNSLSIHFTKDQASSGGSHRYSFIVSILIFLF